MILDRIKEAGDIIFEDMGITYLGPVDGHDIKAKEGMNMKRTINRVLSLTLAGVLAFTSSDLSAFAAQPDVIAEEGASDEDDILATEAELKEKLAGAADETKYPKPALILLLPYIVLSVKEVPLPTSSSVLTFRM